MLFKIGGDIGRENEMKNKMIDTIRKIEREKKKLNTKYVYDKLTGKIRGLIRVNYCLLRAN